MKLKDIIGKCLRKIIISLIIVAVGTIAGYAALVFTIKFIPISKETIEEKFIDFLVTQQNFYKIDPKFITLVCDSINDLTINNLRSLGYHLASKDIFDVYRGYVDYFIYDYHKVNKESIDEIQKICNMHNVICILSNMDTKEDIDLSRDNGYRYLYGDYYRKRSRMKDLLQSIRRKFQNAE